MCLLSVQLWPILLYLIACHSLGIEKILSNENKEWERLFTAHAQRRIQGVPESVTPDDHDTHHTHDCKHDHFNRASSVRSLFHSKQLLDALANYSSGPTPSVKRATRTAKPIRIFVNYSLLDTDPNTCRQPGATVISDSTFTDPITGMPSNVYTCEQADVLTTEKKIVIREHIMFFVKSILEYVLKVVPEEAPLVLDAAYHGNYSRIGRINTNNNNGGDGPICREGVPIPIHMFDEGQADTDFYIIVIGRPVPNQKRVLADANPCSHRVYQDQWGTYFGRPLVAAINFNPGSVLLEQISTSVVHDQFRTKQLVMLGLHEMIHALGFTSTLYSSYVNDDGLRYGETGPVLDVEVPGSKIVRVMTSPRVVKFGQFHFGCSSLKGVELEDIDFGSHWEERVAGDELMSPLTTRVMPLSALTLALLQDTGWYQVNFAAAQRWRWGWRRGCAFVTQPCSENSWKDLFCSNNQLKCNQERSSKAQCNSKNNPATDAHLYFMDNCPTLKSFTNRGFCQDLTSTLAIRDNQYGENFGDSSSCFDVRSNSDALVVPACYQTRCVTNAATNVSQIVFTVFNKNYGCPAGPQSNRDTWVRVDHPSFPGGSIQVLCPQYQFFCENEATESWTLGGPSLFVNWFFLLGSLLVLFFH